MNTVKSIGAILAGFVVVFVLSVGTDTVLEKVGVFPPLSDPGAYAPWMLVLALLYRCVYTVVGGYITARAAPDRPMRHVVVLGIVGIVAGSIGVVVGWNLSAHWYPIAIVIAALPCAWWGGKLTAKSSEKPNKPQRKGTR